MKKSFGLIFLLFIYGASTVAQNTPKFKNDELKWTMNHPKGFKVYNGEEWLAAQNLPANEDPKQSKIEVVFQKDNANYAEFSTRLFDPVVDGDYDKALAKVNGLLYETLHGQMVGAAIETEQKTLTIGGLNFNLFILSIKYPSAQVITIEIYSRLFKNNQELTASILYALPEQGDLMRNAFLGSVFGE